ncbi:hypothetical protein K2Z84_04205 [Candidatus Binatia bacterium]|nr:hypothetical protein [Candidatus Binatia bacterium]
MRQRHFVFQRGFRLVLTGLLLATAAACSGDGTQNTDTVYTGIVFVPPPSQCEGCSGAGATAQLLELGQNQAPRVVKCVRTNERGIYDTSDPNTCPEQSNGELPSGDGNATVIVVATVNSRGGQIGGLISSRLQQAASADFNGTTHIACKAGVFLTAGTAGEGNLGCSVRATCPPGAVNCFTTLQPDELDDARINVLEEASQVLEGQVDYTLPEGVDKASCAVIVCTQAGTVAASTACLEGFLAGR